MYGTEDPIVRIDQSAERFTNSLFDKSKSLAGPATSPKAYSGRTSTFCKTKMDQVRGRLSKVSQVTPLYSRMQPNWRSRASDFLDASVRLPCQTTTDELRRKALSPLKMAWSPCLQSATETSQVFPCADNDGYHKHPARFSK